MKIVIVGDGKVGYALTEQLSREGHDITVIDQDTEVLQRLVETLDVLVIGGNGASLEVQREAEVGKSDLLIAVTTADEINLLCCILAKKLGCPNTIARVRNLEYRQQTIFLREELGLSMTINPEQSAAVEMYRLLQFPSFLKRESFVRGLVELVELKVSESSALCGKPLEQLYTVAGVKVLVCTVERGDQVFIPSGSFRLQAGDKITVTAARSSLTRLIKNLAIAKQKIRRVMLVGGSRIAVYLTQMLLAVGVEVKIIEKDPAKCRTLSDLFPQALIIQGDGSSQEVLTSEGILDTDAVVTLTDMDEENLIISMYAGDIGVPKAITKINRVEYAAMFENRGLDSIVSPKLISANEIVRYVRDMQNSGDGAIIALHRIVNGRAEALEFKASAGTRQLHVPLHQVQLRPNVLIACISRAGKVIIPGGDDCIQAGDTVVVVTLAEETIRELNDIFLPQPLHND